MYADKYVYVWATHVLLSHALACAAMKLLS